MKKRILSMLLCLALLLAVLPGTAQAATEISTISLGGLNYPDAGQTSSACSAFIANTKGISFYAVDWFDRTADRFLEASDTFQAGHAYSVQIWVEADSGYTFKCVNDSTPGVTATIDGQELEVTKAFEYKAFAMVVLTYYFSPIPQKGWLDSVKVTVPAPVAGQRPDYTQLSTAEYTTKNVYFSGQTDENMKNGIGWSVLDGDDLKPDTAVFDGETKYVLRTLLFPEDGYSFHEKTKVYVNGKQAKAFWDYATFMSVSYEFPATGKLETTESHTHTPSDWRTTQVYHYKVCTTCGDMLEQEDHKGGVATCAEKGKCTVCGYEYIETNENHIPDTSKWVARAEMYHFHKCSLCGAHCDIEDHRWSPKPHVTTAAGHAYQCADCKACDTVQPHKPGPAATADTPQTCTECGYIITPATNHTHELKLVPEVAPTCIEPGMHAYYTCDGCSQQFADAAGKERIKEDADLSIPPQGHQISNGWGSDDQTHWRTCAVCKVKMVETDMAHQMENGKCTTCGYDPSAPQQTTPAPTQSQTQPQKNEKAAMPWWTLLLIALGAVGVGIGAGVLVLKLTKKKVKE